MGLLSYIIAKGVNTAARNATINAVGNAATSVISASAKKQAAQDDSVIKNGKLHIKPTRSSEDYLNQNAMDIAQELLGVGFESVVLKPVNKLGEFSAKKYGKIQSISINGHSTFLGVKRVPSSSYIVIEFLDFKDRIDPKIYDKVKPIKSGIIKSIADTEFLPPITGTTTTAISTPSNQRKFCCYCGAQIEVVHAKFCSVCGKELT